MPSFAGIDACRLLQNPAYEWGELEQELVPFDAQETPPR